jgi:hypothetical protein
MWRVKINATGKQRAKATAKVVFDLRTVRISAI